MIDEAHPYWHQVKDQDQELDKIIGKAIAGFIVETTGALICGMIP